MPNCTPTTLLDSLPSFWKIDCPVCRGKGEMMPRSLLLDESIKAHDPLPCDLFTGKGQVELTEAEAY